MIKQKSTILKARHDTAELCREHLDRITQVNKSKIIDSGVNQDDNGHYSWVKIKEWVNE
ncbi:hypothetical protein PP411_gp36 [Vibrio phage vB_VpP_BT-1011]|uniref:Uncharacterized protein n=1 Tax=Vibrio phage vB_VpP_BT-1011 TaxID=2799672 RepID=A0A8F2XX14_9CAUD|nr:hypothetical protein PP411_gp36 [Vibrio phage vB_VpP_BT-1011]QWX10235.1 hypothetical protein vBVpPBT1011_0036 [Vibrio phage vB_VpP_BT-1011]